MPFQAEYQHLEPTREQINALPGPVLLEFGTGWCGYCAAIQTQLAALMRGYPDVKHIKIEDGRGKPLGRSFRVKLWPNLVFLRDGEVLAQAARPDVSEIQDGLRAITAEKGAALDG
jgi:thioredoxin 1